MGVEVTGMDDVKLEIRPLGDRDLVELTVIHQGDRHVAVFAPHEVAAANKVLTCIPPRCEPYDLTAAFQAALGRNPFDQRTLPTRSPLRSTLLELAAIVLGLSFAIDHGAWWQKLLGGAVAATGLAHLAAQARTLLRTRRRHPAPTPLPD